MNLTAFLLVVMGALCIALLNVFSKQALNRGWEKFPALFTAFTRFLAVGFMFLFIPFVGGLELQSGWWIAVLITGALNIGIQFADVKAKSLEDVSLVSPISATTPVLLIFTSMLLLHEYPSFLGWVGVWVLVIGTYVLNMQAYAEKQKELNRRVSWKVWFAPFFLLTKSTGIRFAFLSAFLATFSLNFDAMAYRSGNVMLAGACIFLIVAIANFILGSSIGELKSLRRDRSHLKIWSLVWIGLVLCLAILFSNLAFLYTITPYVGTLRRIQIPFTIILAYFLVGERVNFRHRLVGGSIMALGAILIALS